MSAPGLIFDGPDIPFGHWIVFLGSTTVHCNLQRCVHWVKCRSKLIVTADVPNATASIVTFGKDVIHCLVDGESFFIDQAFS